MRPRLPISLLFLMTLSLGCGEVDSLESSGAGTTCGPEGCFNADAGTDAPVSDVSADIGNDVASETGSVANPLCGTLLCDPDDPGALKCNAGGAPSDGGVSGDAGEQDAASLDAADGDADDEDDADDQETGSMGGSMGGTPDKAPQPPPDIPQDDPTAPLSCQVVNDDGNRTATCLPAGDGIDNGPCVTSADCAAGYACVGDANVGVCRAYCCLNPEACEEGTYCGVMQSRDALVKNPDDKFLLPVCIPANDCELLPGSEGTNRCADGLMCAIVRADGTTACVLPGTAIEGEPCGPPDPGQSPCAEGFVCSKTTNTCLALCRVGDPVACGQGVCQSGTGGMPNPYGVCVGARE
jgi:hypothetical protein